MTASALSVPRVVDFITVKRNVPLAGRSYGHWWLELDGVESYGWWPARCPVRLKDLLGGVGGVLNGVGVVLDGSPTRDPNHGLPADYEFHPVLAVARTDDDLRAAIRAFASSFVGGWRWWTRPTMNCRLFQLALFDAVGLVDGTGNYHTRGSGCPALAPFRRTAARLTGRRRWPLNLPPPGQRVAHVTIESTRRAIPLPAHRRRTAVTGRGLPVSASINSQDAT
jgi:hypothetical protein